MVVFQNLRVYRDLFAVLASLFIALGLTRHLTLEAPAYAAEDRAHADAHEPPAAAGAAPAFASATGAVSASRGAPSRPARAGKERILILGDSMVEVLAPSLNAFAIENGHELVPAIWYGSTTAAWAKTPELGRLLREVDPTMVIVALGSSELTSPSIASRRPFIQTILERIGPRELVWIGPPNWRADTGINDLLEAMLGKDRFFRSEHLELTRKRDGIHPDAAGGRVWSDAFASWLGSESRLGLSLRQPTKSANAPPAHVLGRM